MPKITDNPKNIVMSIKVDKSELKALDNFYQEWRTLSLEQLRFKRGGVIRLAFEEFLDRYDVRKAYQEGNVYSTRLNAHEFNPNDMFSVFEKLQDLLSQDLTKGEKHLLYALKSILDGYSRDMFTAGSLKDTYYQQTQRLFVNQWQVKEASKKHDSEVEK
jgi:hypothetical protein